MTERGEVPLVPGVAPVLYGDAMVDVGRGFVASRVFAPGARSEDAEAEAAPAGGEVHEAGGSASKVAVVLELGCVE